MKTLIIVLLLLLFSIPAFTQEQQTPEQQCAAFSTWVNAVILKKVQGVPEEQVLSELQQEQRLTPKFLVVLNAIIAAVYSEDMPPIQSAADVAAIVNLFYRACLLDQSK